MRQRHLPHVIQWARSFRLLLGKIPAGGRSEQDDELDSESEKDQAEEERKKKLEKEAEEKRKAEEAAEREKSGRSQRSRGTQKG